MKSIYFLFLLVNFTSIHLFAQGIKGTIRSHEGEILPFASIYLPNLNTGASTNINGFFEIKLPPGKHLIIVQYVGYEKLQREVEIFNEWVENDFVLREETLMLREITVRSKREDPAYSIMRKAIAKRKYHLLQYDSYRAKVYMKGTGELKKVPFFVKNRVEKEGLKLNEAYTSESVTEVYFQQPDKIEERVISIHTIGDNEGSPAPSIFIYRRIYEEKIADIVSPLAPSAFSYYKFSYEGSFMEGDIEVSKVKVTPRSRGEQVFEGYIYIIEDLWAVHSFDMNTIRFGFNINLKRSYAEVASKVWMPVTHQYDFSGKVWGFGGEYRYLASISDYQIDLNPELDHDTEIIDEKIKEVPEDVVNIDIKQTENVEALLESEDKLTRKQYKKVLRRYEKELLERQEEPEVIRERKYSVDSLAHSRNADYWESIRPVPLTPKEVKGYQREDSLAQVKAEKKASGGESDSGSSRKNKRNKGFNPLAIFIGSNYNLFSKANLIIDPTLAQIYFNTVEGWNINMSGSLSYTPNRKQSIAISPTFRYGISSEDFYIKGKIGYRTKNDARTFYVEGGNFVEQLNDNEPIHPHINTLSTLIFRRNYMKIYEKQYVKAGYVYKPSSWFLLNGSLEFGQRSDLYNLNSYSLFYKEKRTYTPNQPFNNELEDTGFPQHKAMILSIDISYKPIQRYEIDDGRKIPLTEHSPELLLKYRKGISNVLGSDVDFDHIELGINHGFTFGVRGDLEFELRAGSFLNNSSLYLLDYKHFDGNRTILSSMKPAGSFRLLDYYTFSTNDSYFSGHTHYQFRKFLITQLPILYTSGLKENIFINYLKTTHSPHYYELGYSIDQVFRIFRIEVATSFLGQNYEGMGLRVGIATEIFGIDL